MSVEGEGLSLQGGTPSSQVLEVSLDADNVTAAVTVVASDSAVSIGELSVRALSGVELSGEAQAATLPIEVLQSVSLVFDPAEVEIQRGPQHGVRGGDQAVVGCGSQDDGDAGDFRPGFRPGFRFRRRSDSA